MHHSKNTVHPVETFSMKTYRGKIKLFFGLCLAFLVIVTMLYIANSFDLYHRLVTVERFDDLLDNVLELRRYEKNLLFFKDTQSRDKISLYLRKTEETYRELADTIIRLKGRRDYEVFGRDLEKYKSLLMPAMATAPGEVTREQIDAIRRQARKLVDDATGFSRIERQSSEAILYRLMAILVVFIGFFFLITVLSYRLLVARILGPLAQMKSATELVMQNNYRPVDLSPQAQDEISDLFRAFNKMAREIDTRCDQLVQSRKMASIGTFTSGIAHELNNPINNISLVAQALIEDEEELDHAERHSLYRDLIEQSRRASGIVKNLLEFSRTAPHRHEDVDLEVLVDKTAALIKNELRFHRIRFSKEVRGDLPPLYLEKNSFQQVFINLFLNAVHAIGEKTEKGGEIKVVLSRREDDPWVTIEVIDDGVGIPPDKINEIFDPFFTTKKEGEGTGLGLSVTYNTIRKHDGTIEVQSTPGRGTRFIIRLPVGEPHAAV